MKLKDPPKFAVWLLEHLPFGSKNEALAGDLLEEFRRGRSVVWYWRQALMAVVLGLANDLRTQWPAIGYAALCAIPVPAFSVLVVGNFVLFARPWQLDWPYSTICELVIFYGSYLIYIWLALVIYFLLFSLATRSLSLPRLLQSLWTSAFFFIAVNFGLIALFALLPRHTAYFI